MRRFLLICLASLFCASGQTPSPLELPEVVIVGQEERHIPGGTKQQARPPQPLPNPVLDTLNPLNKHMLVDFFPLPPFPARIPVPVAVRSMLEGSIGQYSTVGVRGYRRWGWGRAALNCMAFAEATQGHRRYADSIGIGVLAHLRFHLPDGLWFQGVYGEATTATHWRRYRLFGDPSAPQRSLWTLRTAAQLDGRMERLDYSLAAGLNMLSLSQEMRGQSEQHLSFRTWALYPSAELPAVGVYARMDVRLWGERSQTVGEFALPLLWGKVPFTIRTIIGLQVARTYTGSGFLVPTGEGTFQYAFVPTGRVLVTVWSRLEDRGIRELLQQNPYASLESVPLTPHDRIGVRAAVIWTPSLRWNIEPAFRFRSVARWWSWQRDSVGFRLWLPLLTAVEATVDALYRIASGSDYLGIHLQVGRATADGQHPVPYYVPFSASVQYEHQWRQGVWSSFGMELVGSRWMGEGWLSGYLRLWGELQYAFSEKLLLVLMADNMLNREIVYWEGYPERGVFISVTARLLW